MTFAYLLCEVMTLYLRIEQCCCSFKSSVQPLHFSIGKYLPWKNNIFYFFCNLWNMRTTFLQHSHDFLLWSSLNKQEYQNNISRTAWNKCYRINVSTFPLVECLQCVLTTVEHVTFAQRLPFPNALNTLVTVYIIYA